VRYRRRFGPADASASAVIPAKAGIRLLINNVLNRRCRAPAFAAVTGAGHWSMPMV
jgi:hypothetical protein